MYYVVDLYCAATIPNCGKYEQKFVKFCSYFNIKVCDIVKLFT